MNHFAFTPPEERPVNGPWGRRRKKKGYDWRDSLQGRLPFSNSCPPLTLPPTAHTHTHSFTIAAKKLLLPYPLASFYIDVIHSHPIFISLSLFFFFFSCLIPSFYPTWCGKKSFNFFLLQTASLLQDILLYIHYFWTTTSISPILVHDFFATYNHAPLCNAFYLFAVAVPSWEARLVLLYIIILQQAVSNIIFLFAFTQHYQSKWSLVLCTITSSWFTTS